MERFSLAFPSAASVATLPESSLPSIAPPCASSVHHVSHWTAFTECHAERDRRRFRTAILLSTCSSVSDGVAEAASYDAPSVGVLVRLLLMRSMRETRIGDYFWLLQKIAFASAGMAA